MSGEAKEIRFKFVVDEQSAQRVNRVLDEMIKRAQELARTLQSVGGGAGGGLMGGGSVGGRAPSAQATMARAGGAQTQKVSFASVLTQNADMFKKVAEQGGAAMRAMTDSLKRGASEQQSAVDKLTRELDGLGKMYDRLGGKASGAFGKNLQQLIVKKGGEAHSAQAELSKLRAMEGQFFPGPREDMAPGAAPQSGFQRFRGFLNSGGGIGSQEISAANLSKMPGIGGMFSGMGLGGGLATAGVGLIAAAAVKAATTAASAAYNAPQLAQANRVEAAGVGPVSYARKLRGGDLSDVRSLQEIQNDADKRREYGEIAGEGSGFWNWSRRVGTGFSAAGKAFGRGEFGDAFSNAFSGTDSVDAQNIIKGRKREYLNNNIEERGVLEDIFRDATSGSLGKMGTMRALGIGNGYKKNGAYVSNSERFLNQFSQFDNSEVVGAVQGIAGSGTRGAALGRNGLLSSVLQAQAAGINGAANIGGVFSRTGQGTNMVDLLRSMSGGGVDVSTAGLLGNYMAGAADNLNLPQFSGQGALGALSFGASGQMGGMVARQNMQGMGRLQTLYAGTRDPAQSALNFANARRVAPDAGFYAQQYLATKLDSNRVADALGPGHFELTDEEKNLGLTPQMIRQQARAIQGSQRFRTMEKGFAAGSDPAKMIAALNGGANLRDYAKDTFGGQDGKLDAAEKEKAVGVYATILRQGNPNMSFSEAEGQARDEMFGLGHRVKKGKMVGDVAGGSIEAKQAKEEAEVRETDRSLKDANIKAIEAQVAKESEAYKRLVGVSGNLAITASTISEIITTFAKNLKQATNCQAQSVNVKAAPK